MSAMYVLIRKAKLSYVNSFHPFYQIELFLFRNYLSNYTGLDPHTL